MGSGRWSSSLYDAKASYRSATGADTFDYFAKTSKTTPRADWKVHPSLDPMNVKWRESRDSAEHPTSTAIAVLFDVTGSMHHIPQTLQKKLPQLLGLLLRKGYVDDPQILFGAIGDATCDSVPIQIGQFESDNRMDENLENFILEGGGGGHNTESYELSMYFMAQHTSLDCFEKRGKKGYLFIIGDENAYPKISHEQVAKHFGDGLQSDMSVEDVARELKKCYEVFYILPKSAAHGGESVILDFWKGLFGQNVLELDDPDAVCETIALSVGLCEGTIDLLTGLSDLKDMGVSGKTADVVSVALASVSSKGAVAKSDGSLPGLTAGDSNVGRL